MSRRVAVLRPEPGAARTAAAVTAAGMAPIRLPLFVVTPVAWLAPPADRHDALLVTSANAPRHAGTQLAALAHLPVHAVGTASAAAARAAGLHVVSTGTQDAAALVGAIPPGTRLLHLAGRERVALPGVTAVTVYAADAVGFADDRLAALAGCIALLHSARAAARLATLVPPAERATIRLVAIAPPVAAAAGAGWGAVAIAPEPRDAAMIALARQLTD